MNHPMDQQPRRRNPRSRRRRRRSRRRRKNLRGSTIALIAVGVVVGVPLLIAGVTALAARRAIWHGEGVLSGGEQSANGFTKDGGTWKYRVYSDGANVKPTDAMWCFEFSSTKPKDSTKQCLLTFTQASTRAEQARAAVDASTVVQTENEETNSGATKQGGTWTWRVWRPDSSVAQSDPQWCWEFTSTKPTKHLLGPCNQTYSDAWFDAHVEMQHVT